MRADVSSGRRFLAGHYVYLRRRRPLRRASVLLATSVVHSLAPTYGFLLKYPMRTRSVTRA